MNYPRIGGLILDATFDTLSNVASYQLPNLLHLILMPMIHTRFYMDVGKQVGWEHKSFKAHLLSFDLSTPATYVLRPSDDHQEIKGRGDVQEEAHQDKQDQLSASGLGSC